jgi:glutaredoxin
MIYFYVYLTFTFKLTIKIANMVKQLTLYSTSNCHLCETALSLLEVCNQSFNLVIIEIAENTTLLEHYALKIPVICREDTKVELNWPFDENMIRAFLS